MNLTIKNKYEFAVALDGLNLSFEVNHDSRMILFKVNGRNMDVWALNFGITSQEQLEAYVNSAIIDWDAAAV